MFFLSVQVCAKKSHFRAYLCYHSSVFSFVSIVICLFLVAFNIKFRTSRAPFGEGLAQQKNQNKKKAKKRKKTRRRDIAATTTMIIMIIIMLILIIISIEMRPQKI